MKKRQSDRARIEDLYREHAPSLLLFAFSITGDRGRAQDAVQQVFLRLLERGNLCEVMDAKPYLFACVRNAVLNDAKTRRRHAPLGPESTWFDPPDRDYSAELKLRQSLAALPEEQRAVMILHIWGELTFSEIGEVLAISSNTAASRYRYALSRLRDAMCAKEGCCAKA